MAWQLMVWIRADTRLRVLGHLQVPV